MWTLASWLVVAALVWWLTGRVRRAFDVVGHMLMASLVITAVLWWVTGADKVAVWGVISKVVPGFALVALYAYAMMVANDDDRNRNSS